MIPRLAIRTFPLLSLVLLSLSVHNLLHKLQMSPKERKRDKMSRRLKSVFRPKSAQGGCQ